jgi:hypothetical protein
MAVFNHFNHSILYAAAFMPNTKKMSEKVSNTEVGRRGGSARIVPNRVGCVLFVFPEHRPDVMGSQVTFAEQVCLICFA